MRKLVLLAAVGGLGTLGACRSLPLGGGDTGEHLVDYAEFDPQAGVLWAEKGGPKSESELRKAHPIFIQDVTVINGTGGPPEPHMDILIEKGRIAEMAKTGEIVPPRGTEKIKATGGTAMPGLVDVLAFASAGGGPLWQQGGPNEQRVLEQNLYAGITTMIVGGDADRLAELREQIKKGQVLGPQLFLAAPMVTVRNGYPSELAKGSMMGKLAGGSGGFAREIANPTDAKAKINELADNKAKFDVIPIVYDVTPNALPKMSADSLRVCIDRSHTRGRKAFVFTGTLADVTDALTNKADAIVHGIYEESLDDEKAAKIAQILYGANVFFAPSLVELWGKGFSVAGQSYPAVTLEKETVDPDLLSAFVTVPKKGSEGQLWKYASAAGPQLPVAADNLKKLGAWKGEGDATVPVVAASTAAGPGLFPGAALHREIGLQVKAGIPAVSAIAGATGRAARLIREDKADFGVLAVGKRADVLVVDGDVTADIANTQRIKLVIANGRVIDRVPLGKWEERKKAKEAAGAAGAEPDKAKGDKGDENAPGAPGAAPKKKKKSTGADEDPEPMGN